LLYSKKGPLQAREIDIQSTTNQGLIKKFRRTLQMYCYTYFKPISVWLSATEGTKGLRKLMAHKN